MKEKEGNLRRMPKKRGQINLREKGVGVREKEECYTSL